MAALLLQKQLQEEDGSTIVQSELGEWDINPIIGPVTLTVVPQRKGSFYENSGQKAHVVRHGGTVDNAVASPQQCSRFKLDVRPGPSCMEFTCSPFRWCSPGSLRNV